jgi:CheY-like chemotaxis protein
LLGMVALVLEGEGYRVLTAQEGGEALDKIAHEMPGVILLDMKMPGMDGWEFARIFRRRYDRQAPIVVLTAAEDAHRRAEEIGAEDYIGKPFEIDDLIEKVQQYLGEPSRSPLPAPGARHRGVGMPGGD